MVEQLISAGIIIVFIGLAILITGMVLSAMKSKDSKVEGGFIAFIGPIPIIGATSKNMFYAVIALSVIVLIIFLLINKRLIL